MKLRDSCQLAADIIDGKYDDELDWIQQAAQARKRARFRPGQQVTVSAEAKSERIAGKKATVLKVNQRTITIGVGEKVVRNAGSDFSYDDFEDGEWNISPGLLEVQ